MRVEVADTESVKEGCRIVSVEAEAEQSRWRDAVRVAVEEVSHPPCSVFCNGNLHSLRCVKNASHKGAGCPGGGVAVLNSAVQDMRDSCLLPLRQTRERFLSYERPRVKFGLGWFVGCAGAPNGGARLRRSGVGKFA